MKEQWIYEQFSTINVGDPRLQKRAVGVAIGCAERPEESLAGRFDKWADLQGAYRFFSNSKITHQALQQPHYDQVLEKARWSEELVLFIQDGSELLFNSHPWTHGLGPTADSNGNGLMFHSCLAAKYHDESEETEILGLGYQEAWVRPEKKSKTDTGKESEVWLRTLKKMGPPKANWVSVGDRANDIYNFLYNANGLGWNYVVRARHDRKLEIEGEQTRLFLWIRKQTAKCTSKLYVKVKGEKFADEVTLEITWAKTKLFAPGNTDAGEEVTYIRAWCPEKPDLEWLLITNLAVNSEKDALRIVKIYRRRWLIEDYHKAVKTGFRIENNQLKQASRIFALFGMIAVIATKLLVMREHCRLSPATPVEQEVPERWITLVERYFGMKLKTVRDFWRALARMGGFIGRKSDGEPGWQTIWKGYERLQDMLLGANLL